jgi:hypothetical protein
MTMEDSKILADPIPADKKEEQTKSKSIAEVIADIESGQWRNMSGVYMQSGDLPHLYEMEPELGIVRRSILLKSDEQTGNVLNQVNSIEEWLKYEFHENGELKEIHSVTYDGTGKPILDKHKKYDQQGRMIN